MKNLYQYLSESIKEYSYRIRLAVPVDDFYINLIKNILVKYDLVSIKQSQTIMQFCPLDFPSLQMGEVHIVDIVTHIPICTAILQQEIRGILNIPVEYLVVRGLNEPLELETDSLNNPIIKDINDPLLNTSPKYPDAEPSLKDVPYGDVYNQKLLHYLAKVSSERKELIPSVYPEGETKNKLFVFLKTPDFEDFNKNFTAVKPVDKNKANKNSELPVKVANSGNFSDDIIPTNKKRI